MAYQLIAVNDAAPGACVDVGMTWNGTTTLTATQIIAGTSMTMSGTAAITGNVAMGGTCAITGNTTVGGTLGVTGATTFTGAVQCNEHITIATTKNLIMTSDSDILVNTDKFTVAGSTGNTVIAGTCSVAEAFTASKAMIMSGAAVAAAHGAYAVPITNVYTGVTTDATSELAATLADGAVGQIKVIKMTLKDTNNCVLTPANFTDGTTITFDATGEVAILMFIGTAWTVLYTNATVA